MPFVVAAALLAIERVSYIWISCAPDRFRAACARTWADLDPTVAVGALFCGFKALQLCVFALWCLHDGGSLRPMGSSGSAMLLGAALVAMGQSLNLSVFWRLGNAGVFYGSKFGRRIPWCRSFPFSVLSHPQYAGAVLSIWGLFLILRFPAEDWWVLPALETAYYVIGSWFEC